MTTLGDRRKISSNQVAQSLGVANLQFVKGRKDAVVTQNGTSLYPCRLHQVLAVKGAILPPPESTVLDSRRVNSPVTLKHGCIQCNNASSVWSCSPMPVIGCRMSVVAWQQLPSIKLNWWS